jgi:hypothetical protein
MRAESPSALRALSRVLRASVKQTLERLTDREQHGPERERHGGEQKLISASVTLRLG